MSANASNRDYTVDYLESVMAVAARLKEQSRQISDAIELLFEAWQNERWVFVIGNGGSASTATHFVADLVKTVVDQPGQKGLKALALSDNIPLQSALVNDWGWQSVYEEPLRTYWSESSIVIAISVHGGSGKDKAEVWSQNLIKAIQFAKDNGGKTIGLAGFDGGAMKELCDVCIVMPAQSTPLVESFHVVLQHLIAFRLKEIIQAHYQSQEGG